MKNSELIAQGAEARLYRGVYLGKACLMKERFLKNYRHPELDARLTKDRIRAEARAIIRAKSAGKKRANYDRWKNMNLIHWFDLHNISLGDEKMTQKLEF